MSSRSSHSRLPLLGSGIFGFGFGALLDVVVFHLILQWHHLLSDYFSPTTLDGLRTNVYYDGLFSLVMVGVMTVGMAVVWRELNGDSETYSALRAVGAILVGAGLFNVFDGVVDHYVLGIHNAVHGTQALNPHWVGASLLLLGVGILVVAR